MTTGIEKKVFNENEIAESIRFYERELPHDIVIRCKEAEGTEIYLDLLIQNYRAYLQEREL